MNYIFIGLLVLLSFYLGRESGKKSTQKSTDFSKFPDKKMAEIRKKSSLALSNRTENRKDLIIETLETKKLFYEKMSACNLDVPKPELTREEVQKLLDVTDDTALRYLNELEREGKIIQIGTSGVNVHYVLPISIVK